MKKHLVILLLILVFATNAKVGASFSGGGRINRTTAGYDINYFITDHLGSTRVVVNENGDIQEQNNYYPFGKQWEYSNLAASTNRYRFSGKEVQTTKNLNYLDFGARMLTDEFNRTAWMSIDPLAEKYYSISPYVYCMNNPVKFVDPDGSDVHITITSKAVGTTQIRLIGNENYKNAPSTVEVPVYQMNITDDVTGKTTNYLVTRDGPVIDNSDPVNNKWFRDDTYNVQNTAFEPKDNEGNYKAVGLEYPNGLGAYAITNDDGSKNLKAEPNGSPARENTNEAKGVMIHVGGEYKDSGGQTRITGSFGCFTLAGKDSGNKGAKNLVNDIYGRQQSNKKANKSTDINVKIQKRKDVDWKWEVDKNGNKIK